MHYCGAFGKKVFLDIVSISIGEDFVKSIIEGINQSSVYICLLGKDYVRGNWPIAEYNKIIDQAITKNKKLITVCLDDEGYMHATEKSIGAINIIDARSRSTDILSEIKKTLGFEI